MRPFTIISTKRREILLANDAVIGGSWLVLTVLIAFLFLHTEVYGGRDQPLWAEIAVALFAASWASFLLVLIGRWLYRAFRRHPRLVVKNILALAVASVSFSLILDVIIFRGIAATVLVVIALAVFWPEAYGEITGDRGGEHDFLPWSSRADRVSNATQQIIETEQYGPISPRELPDDPE